MRPRRERPSTTLNLGSSRVSKAKELAALVLIATVLTGPLGAQTAGGDSPIGALKQLSVEQLMDIEVTSVSKEPEKLLDAASAIQVITNGDIIDSGATS